MGAAMPNIHTAQVSSNRPFAATKILGLCKARSTNSAAPRTAVTVRASTLMTPCLTLALAMPAFAADTNTFGDEAMLALQTETRTAASPTAYEVNSLLLPQLGDVAWSNASQRAAGASGASAFANTTQHIDVTRWLTPDAPRSVGFSLGMTSAAPSASALSSNASAFNNSNGAVAPTSLDLGVRWRSRLDSGRHLDVSAWAQTPQLSQSPDAMGLIWQQQQPVYGTRVEMQWASSRTRGLVPEFGAIGVQLQGGSRLVLRARKGGPMLYYRAKF